MSKQPYLILGAVLLAAAAGSALRAVADDDRIGGQRELELIAVLESDAPEANKATACKQLAMCGTARAVPALVPLLANEQLAGWARIALEAIPDDEVDVALRGALDGLSGRLLVGAINSIGVRRDAAAIEVLEAHLTHADAEVASAAAAALGRIGGSSAVKALEPMLDRAPAAVRSAVAEGCILCAEAFLAAGERNEAMRLYDRVRQANVPKPRVLEATRGVILARRAAGVPLLVECLQSTDQDVFRLGLGVARELGGSEAAKALIAEIGPVTPPSADAPAALIIKKARFGAGSQWADVTKQLAAMVSNNALAVEASNSLAGDPAPGVVKQLEVTYTLGDTEFNTVVPEGSKLQLGEGMADADPRQVLLLYALGDVGGAEAIKTALEFAKNGGYGARVAAVRVLGKIGDASAVPALLSAAQAGGELGQAALQSLTRLEGAPIDAAIAAELARAQGADRAVLIQLVGERGIASAAPALQTDLQSEEESVRLAAIAALGMTAGFDRLPVLIDRLVKPGSPAEAEAAKSALLLAATRMPDRNATADRLLAALPGASDEGKAALLELLGAVGGERALRGVAAAAKTGDEAQQDAASRVLGEWMSADAAPVLLDLARTGNEKFRVRALRGYLRIARQFDLPIQERVEMCRQAFMAARRVDEKRLALEVLARYPAPESLALAVAILGDATVKEDAAAATVAIAEAIVNTHPASVAAAMPRTVAATGAAETSQKATALLRQAQARLPQNP